MSFLGKILKGVTKNIPIVGGLVSAGASLLGSSKQSKASKKAAEISQTQNTQQRSDFLPYIQSGYGANTRMSELLGTGGDPNSAGYGEYSKPFDAAAFNQYKDPGYQFRLQQGQQGLMNSAAAQSGSLSGAALKDLLSYNQDSASQEYNNAFNRYQTQQGNIFSRLSGLSQLGQASAAGTASAGTALAGQAGQSISNAGTASGAGIVGAGNNVADTSTNYWLMKNFLKPPSVGA